jgi:hypothetical protein
MRKLVGVLMLVLVVSVLVIGVAGNSYAALTFPTIALDDVNTIAAGMIGLLGAVWALKKALGFLGR